MNDMNYLFTTLPAIAEVAEFNIDPFTRVQDNEWGVFKVRVVRMTDGDKWAIRRHLRYLVRADSYTGTIEWNSYYDEEMSSFSLEDALAVAEELVWNLKVNHKTAAQIIREFYPELVARIP